MLLPLTVLWKRQGAVGANPAAARLSAVVRPPVRVRPVSVTLAAVMLRIRDCRLALIVTFWASGAASIVSASVIASSTPPKRIVWPLMLAANVIVPAPGWAFVRRIASRSES